MANYVIGPDVAIHLAEREMAISGGHRLLAATLLRSQVLSRLYRATREGAITKKDAERRLDYLRALRIRFLGDRVLQQVAWKIAQQLEWPDTFDAEYIALTRLQADAFITLDADLARVVAGIVSIESVEALR
jgi:predicted nucleic acid-binding protein